MRYAVIGMGAVGGYYGSRLFTAVHDVHFLLRSDYDHVKKHGFEVNSILGPYHIYGMDIYDDANQMPPCDVVIIATKTTQNQHLKKLLPPLLKDDTLVILMQNGIGVEADVEQMFPGIQLAAGVAFINCVKDGPGHLLHKGFGHLTLANYNCTNTARLQTVAEDFLKARVPTQIADYNETRWRKNILNMATNGMTAKHNCLCDELISNPFTCQEVRCLLTEGVKAAKACGVVNIDFDLVEQLITTTSKTHFPTSMKYDYDHNLPMEVEYIYTRPIEEALKHGCEMPHTKQLEQDLLWMEKKS